MVYKLKQKKIFEVKDFEIGPEGLKSIVKTPLTLSEADFTFENISKKIIHQKQPNTFIVLASAVCGIGMLITLYSNFLDKRISSIYDILFYAIPFALLIVASIFTFKNEVKLLIYNNEPVLFCGNANKIKELNSFLEIIFSEQKKYYINKYVKTKSHLTHQQISNNLIWLWEKDIINDIELDQLRIELLPAPNSLVGFNT